MSYVNAMQVFRERYVSDRRTRLVMRWALGELFHLETVPSSKSKQTEAVPAKIRCRMGF
jgi:hypothetical protein